MDTVSNMSCPSHILGNRAPHEKTTQTYDIDRAHDYGKGQPFRVRSDEHRMSLTLRVVQ